MKALWLKAAEKVSESKRDYQGSWDVVTEQRWNTRNWKKEKTEAQSQISKRQEYWQIRRGKKKCKEKRCTSTGQDDTLVTKYRWKEEC